MYKIALVFLCALAVLFPALTDAQIPNPGFETWAGGLPTGWITTNVPPIAVPVTQTATSHTGSSALKGTVVSLAGISSYPPFIWSEFPVAQRYATFSGWYSFSAVGGDSLYGWLVMYKASLPIGVAVFSNTTTRATYTQFNATIGYFGSGVPDSCAMYFGITGSSANNDTIHVGSTFNLDDLSLSGTAAGVAEQTAQPLAYALSQNFPNPFNPSTLIRYQLAGAGPVRLTVYDILGREVATLADGMQQPGTHEARFDGGGLSSGVYFYRLQTAGFVQERKMILQK
ncbi:MAG TPA: T9SS type A sorting domain-containing protein [Bacteroidota bacterium]